MISGNSTSACSQIVLLQLYPRSSQLRLFSTAHLFPAVAAVDEGR